MGRGRETQHQVGANFNVAPQGLTLETLAMHHFAFDPSCPDPGYCGGIMM